MSSLKASARPGLSPLGGKRVPAIFFNADSGGESVRDRLIGLPSSDDRERIGTDIATVEFGWPIGTPTCRSLGNGLCQVRTKRAHNRIARVIFYIDRKHRMVLLHGFIKKTQKAPDGDIELARKNKRKHQRGLA